MKWAKWPSGPTWGEVGSGGQLRQDSDCFGTYSTHAQTCDDVRVQSATEWTASVHTLHMSKPNVTRVQNATQWTA